MDQKIIEKIKKLLALSTSPNEHEAALAAQKAVEMMQTYDLEMSDLKEVPEAVGERDSAPYATMPTWISTLGAVISQHLNCKILISGRSGAKCYRFIGTPTDTAIAEHVFNYLIHSINKIAEKTATPEGMSTRRFRESFKNGAVSGLNEKLKLIKRASTPAPATSAAPTTGTDIVAIKRDAVQAYINSKYPKLRTNRSNYRPSASGYHAGAEAGRNININAGINHANNTKRIEGTI